MGQKSTSSDMLIYCVGGRDEKCKIIEVIKRQRDEHFVSGLEINFCTESFVI